jgi:hypothetical protein
MAKPPKNSGPPKGGPTRKPPVRTNKPLASAAGAGLTNPKSISVGQRQLVAVSAERHIEPRTRPAEKPKSPRTSRPVRSEGGEGLGSPKKLTPKQVQSLSGSVLRHMQTRKDPQPPKPAIDA